MSQLRCKSGTPAAAVASSRVMLPVDRLIATGIRATSCLADGLCWDGRHVSMFPVVFLKCPWQFLEESLAVEFHGDQWWFIDFIVIPCPASQVPSGALGCEASLSNIAQVFLCWGLLFEQRYLHLGSESDIKWLSLYEDWLVERGSWTVIAYVYLCFIVSICLNMSQYQTCFVSMSGIPKLVQTNKPPEVPSHVISLSMWLSSIFTFGILRNRLTSRVFNWYVRYVRYNGTHRW